MEDLIREVAEKLKNAISFLDKVKVDMKLRSEKDSLIKSLRDSLKRCGETINLDPDQETYNDVGIEELKTSNQDGDVYNDVGGETYDDVRTGSTPDDVYDDNSMGDKETYDDVQTTQFATVIRPIECEKLTKPVIAEYIEIKKERKFSITGAWQKRWCVLHSGKVYIYESPKDKQQKEAFAVAGCKFLIRDDITKESKRKERCFEIKNDAAKKNFEFCASDKESLTKWHAAFNLKGKGRAVSSVSIGSDTYDDVGDSGNGSHAESDSSKAKKKGLALLFGKKKPKTPNPNESISEDSTYDDMGDTYDDTPAPLPNDDMYADYDDNMTQQAEAELEADATYEDYDAADAKPAPRDLQPPSLTLGKKPRRASARDDLPQIPSPSPMLSPNLPSRNGGSTKSQSGFPTLPVPSPTLPSRDELTGSGSGTLIRNRPPMPIPGDQRALPPPPVGRFDDDQPLPPPPPPKVEEASADEFDDDSEDESDPGGDDYENMYQGQWDCNPDEDNELSFKRGEVVHIISREYDDYGWWTAEARDGDIGLVPVSYLMKAYDI